MQGGAHLSSGVWERPMCSFRVSRHVRRVIAKPKMFGSGSRGLVAGGTGRMERPQPTFIFKVLLGRNVRS